MIKYLGSKRLIIPKIVAASKALGYGTGTFADAFAGTTRVGQAMKEEGFQVYSNDLSSYSYAFGITYITTNKDRFDVKALEDIIDQLNQLEGKEGWFTENYCYKSRYFQPHNGAKIDMIRDVIQDMSFDKDTFHILMTSLIEAADKVDSTVGLQMAYLKQWSKRSYNRIKLEMPRLLKGGGISMCLDATAFVSTIRPVEIMYYDPPYNQHSYYGNYHIWETLMQWDKPITYGIANKRNDVKWHKSDYNYKMLCRYALEQLLENTISSHVIMSYSSEGFIPIGDIEYLIHKYYPFTKAIPLPYKRYIGQKLGTYNPSGVKVSEDGPTHNTEYLIIGTQSQVKLKAAQEAIDNI